MCVSVCPCVVCFSLPSGLRRLESCGLPGSRLSATAPQKRTGPSPQQRRCLTARVTVLGEEAERTFCSALKDRRDLLFSPLTSTLSSNSRSPSCGGRPVLHCTFSSNSLPPLRVGTRPRPDHQNQKDFYKERWTNSGQLWNFCWN